jgi:hypothetical protein
MAELGLALLILVGLALSALTFAAAWETLFGVGLLILAAGLALGVPAGLAYHVVLFRAVRPTGRWWLRPVALHGRVPAAARPRVLLWFYLGAAGFVMAVLGCVLVAIGTIRSR